MRSHEFLLISILVLLSPGVDAGEDQALPAGVMAARGQGIVTPQEFDAKISKIPAKDRNTILRDAAKVRTIVANLLLTSQLAADARKNEFDQGDDQLKLRMQMAAETELANAWLDHKTYSAPDADYTALAQEYYLLNQERFQSDPSVDVTHLLISNNERTVEEAKLLAQSYLDKTLSEPSDFDELVVLYSEDPGVASNGGHYPQVKRGVMVKPFEQAAFNLKNVGDFSGLVETQFGFHIIRLDKTHPSYVRSFDEVRPQLEIKIVEDHFERIREDYLRGLTSMPTSLSEEEVKAMLLRYFDEDELQLQSKSSKNE
jgi:peptidyl-prolyl cis-trans isomerase C